MDYRDAFEAANEAVRQQTGNLLDDAQTLVLKGTWEGLTYNQMAEGYNPDYLKDVGANLWKTLSSAFNRKVTKKRLKSVLEEQIRVNKSKAEVIPSIENAVRISDSSNSWFVGRMDAIAHINDLIQYQEAKVIYIYGQGGQGKTALAHQYFQSQQLNYLELQIGTDFNYVTQVESWVKRQLREKFNHQIPEDDFLENLEQLKSEFQTQKLGILIDNFDTLLNKDGKIHKNFQGYVELINRVLNEPHIQAITLITSRQNLNESRLSFIETYSLPPLSLDAWKDFFTRFKIACDTPALDEIHKAYGGNALVMKVLCEPIREQYKGQLNEYWKQNRKFLLKGKIRDLISSQFDGLQQININAYYLLLRMGIYAYKDIPKIRTVGLFCLLWELPQGARVSALEILERFGLVEFEAGEYWLHPFIKEESIIRQQELDISSESFLSSFRQEIDKLIENSEEIQDFLFHLNDRFPQSYSSIRQVANRSVYYCLSKTHRLNINITFEALELANALDSSIGYGWNSMNPEIGFDCSLDLVHTTALQIVFGYEPIMGDMLLNCIKILRLLKLFLGTAINLAPDPILKEICLILEELLPSDKLEPQEINNWWQNDWIVYEQASCKLKSNFNSEKENLEALVSTSWIGILVFLMVVGRDIRHDCIQDWDLADDYLYVNKLIIDCLQNIPDISREFREKLEDSLFLPTKVGQYPLQE
ncbi:hypothetical protein [Trichocoleus sp. DQ-U1]|uniref:NACHT C-terminal helical domain 2-containing protein n=1 Tax=Trichocoleus sp. DQ-U1 TaxID=2933926 RepID=UPI0032970A6A